MEKQAEKIYRNCSLIGAPFTPCVTDGMWFISHWDVIETNSGKQATYIFGIGGIEATLYRKREGVSELEDLVNDALIGHIEKNGFCAKLFRFEFDGDKFVLCEKEPTWTNYDCGYIKNEKR